ncbi:MULTISPECIES: NAD-dependent epimerase/dehydratase family protein [Cupriavidus]|uniref:Nucleoside-diphosphate-sugar epimerase n=2 Tax=Cupriavidus TaxID=106589 RepID=A0A7W4VE27_9BURK|nr:MULTISPECIES: NAD(P)-dependent oxidoreductase [Cupriavidus]MBB3009902.1 nucleoside-diphosphate-sugar epimerase [Cupriavidus alkaliphilus]QBY56223.1 NAD(P)-dependent oxidoreductase [Cupriavidus oxalaticus]
MATLVTGGKGFIGARLVRSLVEQGEPVVCLDLKGTPGRLVDISERITFVEGDVSRYEDIENVLREHDISRIAHSVFFSAEERGVAARPEDAELLYRQQMVMTTGTFHLFEAARRAGIRRVLYPSSVQYHGLDEPWTETEPVTEYSPARPTSPYGIGKHLCERLAHEYNRLHGMEIVSIRVSGAYGPGVRFGARGINLIGTDGALGQRVDFSYSRAQRVVLAHVDDIAEIFARALVSPKPPHDVYHVGGHAVSYGELAAIGRGLLPGMEVTFRDDVPLQCSFAIDSSRMTRELGVSHRSLERGYLNLINETRGQHGLELIAEPAATETP